MIQIITDLAKLLATVINAGDKNLMSEFLKNKAKILEYGNKLEDTGDLNELKKSIKKLCDEKTSAGQEMRLSARLTKVLSKLSRILNNLPGDIKIVEAAKREFAKISTAAGDPDPETNIRKITNPAYLAGFLKAKFKQLAESFCALLEPENEIDISIKRGTLLQTLMS